jgi:hypothetical protein
MSLNSYMYVALHQLVDCNLTPQRKLISGRRAGEHPQLDTDAFVHSAVAQAIRVTALASRAKHSVQAQHKDEAQILREPVIAAKSECLRLQALLDRASAAGFILQPESCDVDFS